jgi:hypothetical protein
VTLNRWPADAGHRLIATTNEGNAMIPTDDPRSKMTDREKFMVRSLHTVRIVKIVALKLAKDGEATTPTEAVRKACRFLDIPDHYNADVDETMAACVKQVKAAMAKR